MIAEHLEQNKIALAEHDFLEKIVFKNLNKAPDGRIFNKKALGDDFKISVNTKGRYFSRFVVQNKVTGNNHYLPSVLGIESFRASNVPNYEGSIDRIAQLKKLDANDLQKTLNRIKKHFEALKSEIKSLDSFSNPIHYDMLREIDPSEKAKIGSYLFI